MKPYVSIILRYYTRQIPRCSLPSVEFTPEERKCQTEDMGMCCIRSCNFGSLVQLPKYFRNLHSPKQ